MRITKRRPTAERQPVQKRTRRQCICWLFVWPSAIKVFSIKPRQHNGTIVIKQSSDARLCIIALHLNLDFCELASICLVKTDYQQAWTTRYNWDSHNLVRFESTFIQHKRLLGLISRGHRKFDHDTSPNHCQIARIWIKFGVESKKYANKQACVTESSANRVIWLLFVSSA